MSKLSLTQAKKVKKSSKGKEVENTARQEMIAREAYLRAEQRDFSGGDPVQDWLAAENQVDEFLNEKIKMSA